MDWSKILEILNGLAQPVLTFFTVGLVGATMLLYRSTRRYSKATERLVKLEQLGFADRLFQQTIPEVMIKQGVIVDALAGVKDTDFPQDRRNKQDQCRDKITSAYVELAQQALNEIKIK